MAQVLNLNNEVVKMRKEVRKVRVLTIRKLTRHITKLKAKKGTEDAVLKNHKRAERLLEEIHAMKEIKLDQVTKLALGREINFEIVCRKPSSTATDRAIARLTTHALLKTKIANIKAAVKAFKDARRQKTVRPISSEEHKLEELTEESEMTQHFSSSLHSKTFKQPQNQDKIKVKEKQGGDMGKEHICLGELQKMADSEKKCSSEDFTMQAAEHHQLAHQAQAVKTVYSERTKCLDDLLSRGADAYNSNISKSKDAGIEKEYFDDSTEERFYNQSSGSDENDSDDDFFIGKVRRTKKKKGVADISLPTEKKIKCIQLKGRKGSQSGTGQDTKDKYQNSKSMKLESVFFSSLSDSNKSKNVKRTMRDDPPRNKAKGFETNRPQKQMPRGSCMKQGVKKDELEQSLHPSWEASRKRREQISQLTVFQGKKIKFED
ncbi:serum response factor-binding protein 1 isoform X2 [Rhineura floridana]|uniref:serum response factor-binding protein 1 isoform X2 n=1 Tax=Rhineura floridana TaxID=261503 RepID=UPI002AC86424|nr:serum response factor-binding protein 1 isoform X2 [Rhineura floridana]